MTRRRRHSAATRKKISKALRNRYASKAFEDSDFTGATKQAYLTKSYIGREASNYKLYDNGFYGRAPLSEKNIRRLSKPQQKRVSKLSEQEKKELALMGPSLTPAKVGKTPKGFKKTGRAGIKVEGRKLKDDFSISTTYRHKKIPGLTLHDVEPIYLKGRRLKRR